MSSLANDQCIDKIGAEIVCLNDVLLRLVAISTEQKPVILASAGFIQLVRLVGLESGAIAGFCRGQGLDKAPRLSIRIVIWILPSDALYLVMTCIVFVLTIQIERRQCCLVRAVSSH